MQRSRHGLPDAVGCVWFLSYPLRPGKGKGLSAGLQAWDADTRTGVGALPVMSARARDRMTAARSAL